jgi:hypothetical protein
VKDAIRATAVSHSDWERDREAWNLPRQSTIRAVRSPGSPPSVEPIERREQVESTHNESGGF